MLPVAFPVWPRQVGIKLILVFRTGTIPVLKRGVFIFNTGSWTKPMK